MYIYIYNIYIYIHHLRRNCPLNHQRNVFMASGALGHSYIYHLYRHMSTYKSYIYNNITCMPIHIYYAHVYMYTYTCCAFHLYNGISFMLVEGHLHSIDTSGH